MNKEQFLEDVIAALYDGTIGLEDIEEAYLNHELSNDDIDAISEAIDYIENQEPISEISADLAKKVYAARLQRAGDRYGYFGKDSALGNHELRLAKNNYKHMQQRSGLAKK